MKVEKDTPQFFKPKSTFVPILAVLLELFPIHISNIIRRRNLNSALKSSMTFPQQINKLTCKSNSYILMDSFAIPHWALINTLAAKQLSLEIECNIATFNFSFRNKYEKNLYESLGINNHLRIKLNITTFSETLVIYIQLARLISAGHKVIELQLSDINIGLDVYESYLRRGHATLDLKSKDLYRELWRGIKEFVYFKPLFSNKQISAVLVSHDNYVGPGLLARMAYKFRVPVILINPFEINILQRPFQLYERFSKYKEYFNAQAESWKLQHIERARSELDRRVTGEIGVGKLKYQIKSAFTHHLISRQIRQTKNKKLLILCHDFFDNPHSYSRMLFDDFIDWLIFVVECCKEENVDCYIKLHRDFSVIENQVITEFQRKYPWLSIVNSEVSYHQLYDEGIRFVTTCYGSAGHELPLLGYTVINSSYNPHIAFSFNHHAKSKSDYRQMLIDQVPIVLNEDLKHEIYNFYAVHTFLMWPDVFNLNSFEDFIQKCEGDLTGLLSLRYLEIHFKEIRDNISRNLLDAIKSRRVFSSERCLPQENQELIPLNSLDEGLFTKFNLVYDCQKLPGRFDDYL